MYQLTVRKRAFAGIALTPFLAALASTSAFAQERAEETIAADDAIVVTGSRIPRPELEAPNPIQTFSADNLEQSGETNITDFLVDTPALVGSINSEFNAGSNGFFQSAGLNLLNLRNLGFARTLVLVNSRRHVAGYPGVSSVDINTIPTDLIERVDILTGGVSAIYGADGVSGVVNFVLKRDFSGLAARGQVGISEYGDAGNRFVSLTAGHNFADDRGNVALAYEYSVSDRLNNFARPFDGDPLQAFGLQRNPDDFPDNPNVFDRIPLNDLRYADSSRAGAIDIDFDGIPEFNGDGSVYNRGRLLPSTGLTQGGSSTALAGYQGDYLPYLERHNVNGLFSFEVSDGLRVFAEGKYTRSRAFTISQPTFDFFTYLTPENPYLTGLLGAGTAPGGALVTRDNFDFGIRGDTSEREVLRGVLGIDGKLSDRLRYELSYVYGRSTAVTTGANNRLTDRYYAALDAVVDPATGSIVCRSNLFPNDPIDPNNFGQSATTFTPGPNSGCVPLNFLGEGSPSQAALAFVRRDYSSRARITQQVVSGSLAGDLGGWFELPGGPVGFAVGGEYRKETSNSVPSDDIQQGNFLDTGQIAPETGKFDVAELFGEVNIPILRNRPFFELLSVGGAIRISDYSTVGRTTTWKVDGTWSPVADIMLRGTLSEAVRAPNISELFAGAFQGFEFINDPCDPSVIDDGASSRPANCLTLLQAAGLTPAQIAAFNPANSPIATASLPSTTGGNANLKQETARTWTAGVVLRPSFLPGFSATVDYYNIKLRDAINTATAQQVVDLCVDQATPDNVFCDNITRSPATGFISNVLALPQNVANFDTAGLDVALAYKFSLSPQSGTFNVRLVGGYLDKLTFISTNGAQPDDDVNEQFSPKYIGTLDATWTKGPFTLNYGLSWQGKTRRYTTEQLAANPDRSDPRYFFYKERWEHDVYASYEVEDRFTFYGGVNNFTDQKPDISVTSYPVSAVGRYFYVGAKIRMPGFR